METGKEQCTPINLEHFLVKLHSYTVGFEIAFAFVESLDIHVN